MKVGERIKNRREELGLTQLDLAKRLGYKDRSTIAYIEKDGGRLSIPKLQEFARVLGVTPEYLMGLDDEEKESHIEMFKTNLSLFGKPEILTLYESMNKEGQEMLLATARAFASQGIYKKCDSVEENA